MYLLSNIAILGIYGSIYVATDRGPISHHS